MCFWRTFSYKFVEWADRADRAEQQAVKQAGKKHPAVTLEQHIRPKALTSNLQDSPHAASLSSSAFLLLCLSTWLLLDLKFSFLLFPCRGRSLTPSLAPSLKLSASLSSQVGIRIVYVTVPLTYLMTVWCVRVCVSVLQGKKWLESLARCCSCLTTQARM